MKFDFDINKPYFDEIKKAHKQLKKVLKSNKSNSFINEMRNSIQGNDQVLQSYPTFFKKVLLPISHTKRFFGNQNKHSYNTPAVGTWFGYKGWKNISHIRDNDLIETLTQEHIDLIPDVDKRALAQDFYNYAQVFNEKESKENTIEIPMQLPVNLFGFNWLQIRDMNCTYKSVGYYSSTSDSDYENYVYPKKELANQITKCLITYKARSNEIYVRFYCNKTIVEEILINKESANGDVKEAGENNSYMFLSERLLNFTDFSEYCNDKLHEVYVGDIETLLIKEVKEAISHFIAKQKIIKDDWSKLQMKYAEKLLLKGKI